jgi:hypothetical protein
MAIKILTIVHHPNFYLKHDFSETGFCLSIQVELTQLGPTDRASFCFRTIILIYHRHKPIDLIEVSFVWSAVLFQANRTAVLVHRLLNKTRDPDIKEEVKSFTPLAYCWREHRYELISFNNPTGIKRGEENDIMNDITIWYLHLKFVYCYSLMLDYYYY